MGRKPQIKGGSVVVSLPIDHLRQDEIVVDDGDGIDAQGCFFVNRIRSGVYLVKHSDVASEEISDSTELVNRVDEFVDDVDQLVNDQPLPTP